MIQVDLFPEEPTATEARDAAISEVEDGAGVEWIETAMAALRAIAAANDTFTSDDLWRVVETPREPRALGAVLARARKEGVCEATPLWKQSARATCHARPIRIWKSLLRAG